MAFDLNPETKALITRLLVASATLGVFEMATADDHGPLHYLNIQTITPARRADFLTAMRSNATQSREEAANIAFDIADQGGSDPTLVLFESWQDRAGYNQHEASAHVAPVIALVPEGFAKPERKYLLQDVVGLPPATRKPIDNPSATHNVIARLNVRPDQHERFVQAAAALLEVSRKSPGNLVFNVYQERSAPDRFVIYERWSNDNAYGAHCSRDEIEGIAKNLDSSLAAPPETFTLRDRIFD